MSVDLSILEGKKVFFQLPGMQKTCAIFMGVAEGNNSYVLRTDSGVILIPASMALIDEMPDRKNKIFVNPAQQEAKQ